MRQPIEKRAASTRFALAAGHVLTLAQREVHRFGSGCLFVLESVRHHAESQRADTFDGLFPRLTVRHHPWQIHDFSQPSTILFKFDLEGMDIFTLTVS